MKEFAITIRCESSQDLLTALDHIRECVLDDPNRYDEMAVDDLDEMLEDPEYLEISLSRSE